MRPKISVILVNYYGDEDTRECIRSLRGVDYEGFEIVVVNNGSGTDEMEKIRAEFPDVVLLGDGRNTGFAGGNNAGIRYALKHGAEYVLLLNNDTTVDKDILREFLRAAERHPGAGFFSAGIYFYSEPQKIWFVSARFDEETMQMVHEHYGKMDDGMSLKRVSPTV
ncbi:MAG: glycosyltransferase family 2 protein, partial [Candidatus Omnitrophica bacterium]|nr:glycosyltransferase family 2 protein [Candidatus Omnitrophota bacterium]